MDKFSCEICKRVFLSQSGLTRHANAMHHGRLTSFFQRSQSQQSIQILEHNPSLWSMPITRVTSSTFSESSTVQIKISEYDLSLRSILITRQTLSTFSESSMEQIDIANIIDEPESEPRYYLRSQVELESEENLEENVEEMKIDLQEINFVDCDFDREDLQGASFDDALDVIEGKNRPELMVMWPNKAYRDFMELIIEGNIINKIGDKIIKFFNKHSSLKDSPLPSSTKNGKDYLNQINSPSLDFKEKNIATYNEVNFTLYYRPIFRAIQTLLQRSEVADKFVHKGILKKDAASGMRIFGEVYEGN